MKNRSKIVAAITSLIRKTQEGALQWKAVPPTGDLLVSTNEETVGAVYVAEMAGRLLRLYSYTRRYWADESLPYWQEHAGLEVSDENKKSWWRFPHHPATADLLEAVRYRTVGVDQFLDKLAAGHGERPENQSVER